MSAPRFLSALFGNRHALRAVLSPSCVVLGSSNGRAAQDRPAPLRVDVAESPALFGWPPAVAALREALGRMPARDAALEVVLSGHFARLAVLDLPAGLDTRDEELAYARLQMADTYGDAVDAWEVVLEDAPPGARRLVAAIDRDLLAALAEAAQTGGLRLRSVRTRLVDGFNRHRAAMRGHAGWFAFTEPGRVDLLRWSGRTWSSVDGARARDDVAGPLVRLLRRADAGGEAGDARRETVHVASHTPVDLSALPAAGFDVVRLTAPGEVIA
jgi:hypothetical protein